MNKNGLEITALYFLIFILFTYLIIIMSTGWWRLCRVRIAKEWHFAASLAKEAP